MRLIHYHIFILGTLLACVPLLYISIKFHQFANTPLLSNEQETTIIVRPGMSIHRLIHTMRQQQVLSHPRYFLLLGHLKGVNKKMRIGEYLITETTTPRQLLDHIVSGQVYMRKITLIEGWTFKRMRQALQENDFLKHTLNDKSDEEIMLQLSKKQKNPEGLFYPDTYVYTWGNTDMLILKKAYQHMQQTLQQQWKHRALGLPYKNAYQALIVASMIERETAVDSERALIAGVILGRLKKGMRLQIDPTVLYGAGKPYGATITQLDLKNQSPYNTYMNSGLPPTPIAMPGEKSIAAALHPQRTGYLYYVARGDGDGRHQFSKTYHEHRIAVKKLRKLQQN